MMPSVAAFSSPIFAAADYARFFFFASSFAADAFFADYADFFCYATFAAFFSPFSSLPSPPYAISLMPFAFRYFSIDISPPLDARYAAFFF